MGDIQAYSFYYFGQWGSCFTLLLALALTYVGAFLLGGYETVWNPIHGKQERHRQVDY